MTSDVMDLGNGVYSINGRAAAVRGGVTGAIHVAYKDATKYCQSKNPATHAIILNSFSHDVYNASSASSWNQGTGYSHSNVSATGNADLVFKCGI